MPVPAIVVAAGTAFLTSAAAYGGSALVRYVLTRGSEPVTPDKMKGTEIIAHPFSGQRMLETELKSAGLDVASLTDITGVTEVEQANMPPEDLLNLRQLASHKIRELREAGRVVLVPYEDIDHTVSHRDSVLWPRIGDAFQLALAQGVDAAAVTAHRALIARMKTNLRIPILGAMPKEA